MPIFALFEDYSRTLANQVINAMSKDIPTMSGEALEIASQDERTRIDLQAPPRE